MTTLRNILVLLIAAGLCGPAAAQTRVQLEPESSLTIVGRSTISRFSCEADNLSGNGVFAADRTEAVLTVPVHRFDCGKVRMNRDLQEAMEADRHPEIRFELVRAEANALSDIEVLGRLTIAGVTRTIVLHPEAEETSPGTFRVRGEKDLQMSDFGIEPPTALAGLIRTHDDIVVRFDVRATTTNANGRHDPTFGLNQAR